MRAMRSAFRGAWLLCLFCAIAAGWPSPAATRTAARKKLLFLTHAGLYKHPSLPAAEKAVAELGNTGGYDALGLDN
jgi:hypothetical protein